MCRTAFPSKPYVSLETPAQREFALRDPVGFLQQYPAGVILDEIQRAPDLPSYLQAMVDDDPQPGRFILTGSQNLAVTQSVSQSLAGRTALLQLLPLALEELRRFEAAPSALFDVIWTGGYPRILDRRLPAAEWLASYTAAYVERDVRQILKIGDLLSFQTFLRLTAGRVGQLLNLSSLGNDCGVTHMTARSWISVLEASFLVFRLPPFHRNLGKRLVKSPKLYFYDTGLLCHLLGIEKAAQLATHPLRGAIFENWVIAEIAKYWSNRGRVPAMFFYRDQRGNELDLLIEHGDAWSAVEIKSSATAAAHFYDALDAFGALARQALRQPMPITPLVVYGGAETQQRSRGTLLSWADIDSFAWLHQLPSGAVAKEKRGRD
ncbi:ATP-binding protein [Candidatus Binatia bacterium]|nr:ATP-binding protein [Candidatus Binatia bacterium]